MRLDNPNRDDEFAERLAAIDIELAMGVEADESRESTCYDVDDELSDRLDQAKQCLELLEQIWPRSTGDEFAAPTRLGRFRILRELGRGGFGIVYLAYDDKLDRTVALKVQRPEATISPELRERFIREARAVGRLRHPHIAAVHEVGQAGFRIWIACEYHPGETLADWLREHSKPISPHVAARFAIPLAQAMEYSHQQGILHRDLKPSNVILERIPPQHQHEPDDISNYEPRLIDFGMAKVVGETEHRTRTGAVVGTPAYMAPEQANGYVDQISPATDVYGLGAILFELLVRRPPFAGEGDLKTLRMIVEDEPVRLRKMRPDIPRDLEAICLKCLAKKASERYTRAADLATDLQRFLDGNPTHARPLSVLQKTTRWIRKRPALASLVGVTIAAVIVVTALAAVYAQHLVTSRETADELRRQAENSAGMVRRQAYASAIRTGLWAWEANRYQPLAELKTQYDNDEIAGFELRYLLRLAQVGSTRLPEQPVEVDSVAISPAGDRIAIARRDGIVEIWDANSKKHLDSFRAHETCANLLRYSPSGELLATASCDATIRIWNANELTLVNEIRSPAGPIYAFRFSPQDDRIYAAGSDNRARAWAVSGGALISEFGEDDTPIQCVAISGDGSLLAAGGSDGSYFVWEVDTGRLLRRAKPAAKAILGLCFLPGPSLAYSSLSPYVEIVSLPEGELLRHIVVSSTAHCLEASADGQTLFCGTSRGILESCEPATGTMTSLFGPHTDRITDIAVSADGRYLGTSSQDGTCVITDLTIAPWKKLFQEVTLPRDKTCVALYAQTGQMAVIHGDQNATNVFVQDLSSGARTELPRQQASPIASMNFSPEGDLVLRLPETTDCEVWNVAGESPVLVDESAPRAKVERVATESAGKTNRRPQQSRKLVVERHLNEVRVLDVERGTSLGPFSSPSWTTAVELSPDLQSLAAAHGERVRVFALSGTKQRDLVGNYAEVRTLAFSPDSKTIATGGDDRILRLWSVATGREMLTLKGHTHPIVGLAFARDGSKLFSLGDADADGRPEEVFCWRAD